MGGGTLHESTIMIWIPKTFQIMATIWIQDHSMIRQLLIIQILDWSSIQIIIVCGLSTLTMLFQLEVFAGTKTRDKTDRLNNNNRNSNSSSKFRSEIFWLVGWRGRLGKRRRYLRCRQQWRCRILQRGSTILWRPGRSFLGFKCNGNLNSELVWYSNGWKQFDRWMVPYFDHHSVTIS